MKKLLIIFLLLLVYKGFSQENYLGDGPFDQLIIRGVTLINGDGSPPRGPVDIVVENNTVLFDSPVLTPLSKLILLNPH